MKYFFLQQIQTKKNARDENLFWKIKWTVVELKRKEMSTRSHQTLYKVNNFIIRTLPENDTAAIGRKRPTPLEILDDLTVDAAS